ncbi:glycoside hydrolase family 1 protein, partial [Streptomyces sp. NPDC002920]
MSPTPDLRPDFLWGASTSPHQIEGNNLGSDWWRMEQQSQG